MIRYISFFLIFTICLSRSEENLNTNNGHNNKPVIIEISHNEKKQKKSNKINKINKIIPSFSSGILLVISTSILYAFGKSIYSYFNMSAQINEISGRTSDIHETQTLHTTLLKEAKAKLDDLSTEISKIRNTQLADSEKIQQTLASIEALEEKITTLSNTIEKHHTENRGSFSDISTKIDNLQLELNTLSANIEKLIDERLSKMEERIDEGLQNLDKMIKSNQETIKSNQQETNDQLKSILEAITKPNQEQN